MAAGSGGEGLALVRAQAFDAALLDVKLPDADGVEMLGCIKQFLPDLEAVIMTAFESEQAIRRAFSLGVYTCLRKPFEVETLLRIFRELDEKHE